MRRRPKTIMVDGRRRRRSEAARGEGSIMEAREFIDQNAPGFLTALAEWLAIPSISGDPDRAGAVRQSAEWLAGQLRATGFPVAEVWETGSGGAHGMPAVYAEWPAADPDAPVALVYGHHDVQPVEPLDEWDSPPFAPVQRDGLLFGRGASDDKGQVYFHLLGVRANLAASGSQAPPVTIKMLIEGEEESGSPYFADLLRRERDRLRCDVVVVTDTGMWAADVPSMCVGMRGVIGADIDLRGPTRDLHSGSFGGGVPNPLHAMASLLAGLHDDDGRVTIPGFYDKVRPISAAERELLGMLPFDEKAWLAEAGDSGATTGEVGYGTLERIWARPTAEVNGMWGGHTGPGGKTIIPAQAHAKLSFRLVADQEPTEVIEGLRRYVRDATPPGIEASVVGEGNGVRACFSPMDDPAVAAGRRALSRAFDGQQILFTREGGSGPEADLAEILQAPLVFIGVGLDADRVHAPNERVSTDLLLRGAEAAAYLWDEFAASAAELTASR
jgi:acetylornithine deacetylase/succinyl-diaminopimelate desuccinylase-like protein